MLDPYFYNIAEICAQLDVKDIILSPGSRCAPLTLAFARHPEIKFKTFSDERSAAYVALGMALATKEPVGLVCTSGTAAANYLPAVTEAFYQNIPLIVFTADRPPELIDQQDGQAIRQFGLYQNHIKKSFQLPVELGHDDARWHFRRIISEAINLARQPDPGPVHINCPFREPFYPSPDSHIAFESDLRIQRNIKLKHSITVNKELIETVDKTEKVLIIGGQKDKDEEITGLLSELSLKNITVVGDVISNLHEVKGIINLPDNFLSHLKADPQLKPDLLITFGNSVISKNLKLYLRKFQPAQHWHIQNGATVADQFKSVTHVIRTSPKDFLKAMHFKIRKKDNAFRDIWQEYNDRSRLAANDYLENVKDGEFLFLYYLMRRLPDNCNLHLANSMSVRYVNFIGLNSTNDVRVFSNRGTSGIDGCSSTAVGISLADSTRQNFLITGDMAFLYDRNAFWHNYALKNLKIIVINNQGGVIFRMIDGPSRLPELEDLFETRQKSSARFAAEEFNMKYFSFTNAANQEVIDEFLSSPGLSLLEFFSSGDQNQLIFRNFKKHLSEKINKKN